MPLTRGRWTATQRKLCQRQGGTEEREQIGTLTCLVGPGADQKAREEGLDDVGVTPHCPDKARGEHGRDGRGQAPAAGLGEGVVLVFLSVATLLLAQHFGRDPTVHLPPPPAVITLLL